MAITIVHADWVQDQMFRLQDRGGFAFIMDRAEGVTGSDLLPLGLIGCAAWDVVSILVKQRQQLTALQVTAESEQDPEPPWRFRRIHICYRFTGHDLDPERIRRAIELGETKYCSIFATLRDVVEITSDFEIAAA